MSDLISRQAVLDAIVRHNDKNVLLSEWEMNGFVECIKALPSAPDSRQRGEWILTPMLSDNYRYECSNCMSHHRARYDYCPSCGADMRGEEE